MEEEGRATIGRIVGPRVSALRESRPGLRATWRQRFGVASGVRTGNSQPETGDPGVGVQGVWIRISRVGVRTRRRLVHRERMGERPITGPT
jgi:hypothetical protein